MAYEKDPNELGALWMKSGAKGEYMTGSITVNGETIKIVCFAGRKSSDKSPDWRVLKSVPRESAPPPRATDSEPPFSSTRRPDSGPVDADDIPF